MAVDIAADLVLRDVIIPSTVTRKLKDIKLPNFNQANDLTRTLDKLNVTLDTFANKAAAASKDIKRLDDAKAKSATSTKAVTKNVRESTNALAAFSDQSALALRRFTAFSVAAGTTFGTFRAITGGFREAIKFERELVRVAQVSDKQLAVVQRSLGKTIGNIATEFGVASAELNRVSTILAQSGQSIREVEASIRALAKSDLAANFNNIADTAQGAIAVFSQFGIQATQLEQVLNRVNAVSGSFAVEAGDIFAAVQKAGGVFSQSSLGDSVKRLEEFTAVFTAVRSQTRESADTIATGLRTIFARIKRPATIKFLQEMGIQLEDAQGKFIGILPAIEQVNKGLNQLSQNDTRRSAILEQIGGFRQIGRTTALFSEEGVKRIKDALETQRNAGNSLNDDLAPALATISQRFDQLQERFLRFVRSLSDTQSFKELADTFFLISNSLLSVAESAKEVIPLIAALSAGRFAGALISSGGARAFGSRLFGGSGIPRRAMGGPVPGQGSGDRQLILAEAGEFVIRKNAAQKLGRGTLNKLNNIDRFQNGGMVGGLPRFQDGGSVGLFNDQDFRNISEFFVKRAQKYGVSLESATREVNKLGLSATKLSDVQKQYAQLLQFAKNEQLSGRSLGAFPTQSSPIDTSAKVQALNVRDRKLALINKRNARASGVITGPGAGIAQAERNAAISIAENNTQAQISSFGPTQQDILREQDKARRAKEESLALQRQQADRARSNNLNGRRFRQSISQQAAIDRLGIDDLETGVIDSRGDGRNRAKRAAARAAGRRASFRRGLLGQATGLGRGLGNRAASGLAATGRGLLVGGAGGALIAGAQFDRQTGVSGALGGGFSGVGAGALAGSSLGPLGAAVGAIGGGAIGAAQGFFDGKLNEASNKVIDSFEKLEKQISSFDASLQSGTASQEDLNRVLNLNSELSEDLGIQQTARGNTINSTFGTSYLGEVISDILSPFETVSQAFQRDPRREFLKESENLLAQSGEFTTFDRLRERFTFTQADRDANDVRRREIEARQRRRNAREQAESNEPAAQAARRFIEQELIAGRGSQLTNRTLAAAVSNNADTIGASEAANANRARRELIPKIQDEINQRLASAEALSNFNGILAKVNNQADKLGGILSLNSQALAGGQAAGQNILDRANGRFRSQIGGRTNIFNNLGVASQSELSGAIGQLQNNTGQRFGRTQLQLLQAGRALPQLGEILRTSVTGEPLGGDSAVSAFKNAASDAFGSNGIPGLANLPDEIKTGLLNAIDSGISEQDVTNFRNTGELPAVFDKLADIVDKNAEGFQKLQDSQNEYRDAVAKAGNDFSGLLVSIAGRRQQGAEAASNAISTRASLFGGSLSVGQQQGLELAGVRAAAGTTNVDQIRSQLNTNNRIIQARTALAPSLQNDALVNNQRIIAERNADNEILTKALEQLSTKIVGLAAIQEKLAQIEQERAAKRNQALDLAFGGPEATRQQARGQAALNIALKSGTQGLAASGLSLEDARVGFESRRQLITDPEQRDAFEAQVLKRFGFTGDVSQTKGEDGRVKDLQKQFDAAANEQQKAIALLQDTLTKGTKDFGTLIDGVLSQTSKRLEEASKLLGNLPDKIEMDVKHSDIQVNINGAEQFTSLTPHLQAIIYQNVNAAIRSMTEGATPNALGN